MIFHKVRLGEVIRTNITSYNSSDAWEYVNYLDTGNITENIICDIQYIDLSKELLPSRAKRKVQYNSIVYSTVRPNQKHYGIIKNVLKNFLVSTGFAVIDAITDRIDADYLFFLLTQRDIIESLQSIAEQSVSAYPSIKASDIENLEILLPELNDQKKIATILKSLNEKVECNRNINDNLLEQMQAIYKSWFVDYLPFGGVMPESWTKTGIYSLANIIYGAPFASKQFNTEGHGKPIIRIRDLKDQQFATYTTEVHPKGYLLRPGDIVVGMDGEFRPYIWGNDEAWLNQRVCVFENKRPKGKAFLYFTIKPLLYAIEQTQVATTVIHIGKKDYDAFEIMLPDAATLDSFDSLTAPMIMQIVSNSFENKRLAVMRDALLPKLMSGEIDVSAVQL